MAFFMIKNEYVAISLSLNTRFIIMARTLSNMLSLGTLAPEFSLLDTISKKKLSLKEVTLGAPFVLMFICNHCPFVIHLHEGLKQLVDDLGEKGVRFMAINSNDVEKYPEDAPQFMTKLFDELGFDFPYFFDESQDIAIAYRAACTPDFYVFDEKKILVYRGEFDDSRPENKVEVTGNPIRKAVDDLLNGHLNSDIQKPSMGCGIKWK